MNEIAEQNKLISSAEEQYHSVHKGAGVAKMGRGVLMLEGKDSLDFLHRLSTNDLLGMKLNEHRTTVFVTEKGRIIDVVTVIKLQDSVLLIVSEGSTSSMKSWLEKFIFIEDVEIKDITTNYQAFIIIGAQAETVIKNFFHVNSLSCQVAVEVSFNNHKGFFYNDPMWRLPVYHIFFKSTAQDMLLQDFLESITELPNCFLIDSNTMETIRIEEGVPRYGKELTEYVHPLEVNLEKFVSFTKGCYIGQEVIARLDTYKKVQRKLCSIVIESPHKVVHKSGKLYFNQKEVGWTTSHSWSYKLNKQIALGYLKTNALEAALEFRNDESPIPISCKIIIQPIQ